MTRKLCDCCAGEIHEALEHGHVRVPVALYEHLAGRNPTLPNRREQQKQGDPFAFLIAFASEERTVNMDVCGDCLRRFVHLREQMQQAIREGLLR